VLIVDDSIVARSIFARMIQGMAGLQVAASVGDAHSALQYLSTNRVDLILLDVEMPGVDGLTALPDLLIASDRAKVLVVSSSAEEGMAATVQALALGGADTLVKPGAGNFAGRFADVLEERLTRLLDRTTDAVATPVAPTATPGPRMIEEFDLVAIGASTGGIHALSQLLRAIPREFQKPILVTQHLPVSFMGYFATQLALLASRPCDVASDRMRIRDGRIYVAPGNAHLRVARMSDGAAIRLSDERSLSGCMPSVDPMFESVADVFGRRALGIVLSGMGRDGSDGARKLAEAGASVVVQDRESSVVWGMPGAVAGSGNAAAVLNPAEIGHLIATRRKPL
jgi:two-component system chemotaxis response regulator CheB